MPGSLERIPVKALGYADQSNQMEAMKREWMMEESSDWGMPSKSSAAARLPEFVAPPVTAKDSLSATKPPSPKVLEEMPALPMPESKPRIGLGN